MTVDPPSFDRTGDPDRAKDWLSRMNRLFTCGGYESEQKMTLVAFFLRGRASLWWDNVMKILRGSNDTRPEHKKKLLKWSNFEKKFRHEYISATAQD